MERHSPLTLDQILTQLASVLGHKQTGTFYIATDNNTSCRFAVNAGKLTHCTHRRDQGAAALRSILDIQGGSCFLWVAAWWILASDSPATHPRISKAERAYIEDGKFVWLGRLVGLKKDNRKSNREFQRRPHM